MTSQCKARAGQSVDACLKFFDQGSVLGSFKGNRESYMQRGKRVLAAWARRAEKGSLRWIESWKRLSCLVNGDEGARLSALKLKRLLYEAHVSSAALWLPSTVPGRRG